MWLRLGLEDRATREADIPDFTVIDGGGDRGINGFAGQLAVQCLEDLVIEILRDLARDQ
jgi:hypothetical protein